MSRDMKQFINCTTELNFTPTHAVLNIRSVTTELNYDIDSFDSGFPMYKILLDFIQTHSGLDILY